LRPFAEHRPGAGVEVFADVVDIDAPLRVGAEPDPGLFPDPRGAVGQDTEISESCRPNRSLQRFHPAPTSRLSATEQLANRIVGSGSTRSFHCGGAADAAFSRFCSRFSRISFHPPVVLIFSPSVKNSGSPPALENAPARLSGLSSGFFRSQCCALSPCSWQTRSIVSSLTVIEQIWSSFSAARSNDQAVATVAIIRLAGSVACGPLPASPAQASHGVQVLPHDRQA
jgi:hypothetical protein